MSVHTATTQTTRRSPIEVEPVTGLTADSLTLRALGYSDESAFLDALERSRTALRRWIPLESKGESAQDYFHRQVEKGIEGDRSGTACRRAIFLGDNTFAGMVNIIKIERGMEWSAEANWWVESGLAGKGIGTLALQTLLDHALADMPIGLGLHSIRAMICLDNPGSVRMAQKLGFTQTTTTDLLEVNDALVMHHEFTRSA